MPSALPISHPHQNQSPGSCASPETDRTAIPSARQAASDPPQADTQTPSPSHRPSYSPASPRGPEAAPKSIPSSHPHPDRPSESDESSAPHWQSQTSPIRHRPFSAAAATATSPDSSYPPAA